MQKDPLKSPRISGLFVCVRVVENPGQARRLVQNVSRETPIAA
jgi:hypothetical protein